MFETGTISEAMKLAQREADGLASGQVFEIGQHLASPPGNRGRASTSGCSPYTVVEAVVSNGNG